MILGVDEVGRGAWAGPLVAGAVILPDKCKIKGLNDSKLLGKLQREKLAKVIEKKAEFIGLGWVWPQEIDVLGLTAATTLAMTRAIENCQVAYHEIIIDGNYNYLVSWRNEGCICNVLINADATIAAVSAASIVAKVARDDYMAEQSITYKEYGFDTHVGYGTQKHRLALLAQGLTPIHRRSYKPISALV